MLPKDYRLKKDTEIRAVLGKGRGFYSKLLGVKMLQNKLKNSRFCFVVANKVHKKASKRNLLRRRLREIIHLNLDKIKGNYDIVIMVRPGTDVLDKKYADLEKDLTWILKKIGLI